MTPPRQLRAARPADQQQHRWRARPVLAAVLRATLLAVPLVASAACAVTVARALPPGSVTTWWGLTLVLATSVVVAVAVERAARRLLPLAVLLRLSMLFPDRAPSRLRISRDAALRQPSRTDLVYDRAAALPTTTSQLVLDLVTALGAHDRRTRGHSERVRVLTDMLADELALDQDARDRLRWSALLHDVGKMQVSAAILNKPSRLDTRELDRMRQHPQAGAALAAPLLPWLGEWGEGILDHHERYDGSGYPHGKAGEAISSAGRILAVVDAFETMTAARAYKKPMATRAAREELARCAGSHFDPFYVRAFLALSLPRVLWAMGPVSFLLQLPFLPSLAQAGARAGAAGSQGAAAAAGAAGAAVLATGGLVAAGEAAGVIDLGPQRPPQSSAEQVVATAPDGDRPQLAAAEHPPAGRPPADRVRDEGVPAGSVPAGGVPAGSTPAEGVPPAPAAPPAGDPAATPSPPPPAAAAAGQDGPRDQRPPPAPGAPPQQAPQDPAPEERADKPADRPAERPADRPAEQDAPAPVPHTGAAIVAGPPSTTTELRAAFTLREVPGVQWECKLPRNAAGSTSAWQPCSGTFTLTLLRDGRHVLRVREAATDQELDSWTWTVTSPG